MVNVDCTGRVYRGLAEAWTRDTIEQKWLFVLRSDARFWDGTRLTAEDVVASLAREGVWSASLG
ncbi:MAG TPA: ABC transporter substrate-binding protein, partial [Gemmatimonadales bacterium]|nr:ABC transporter substrate-binding protein [Gemmatimonadales bacterium]